MNTPGASWTPGGLRLVPAHRGRVAETGVVEPVVDEQRVVVLDPVTHDALRLAGEQREPALDGCVDGIRFPPEAPPVERRAGGEQRALVTRERLTDGQDVRPAAVERRLEHPLVVAHAPDLADRVADGGRRHLVVRRDRLPRLVLQAQLPSVEEQVLLVRDVVQGG